MEVGPWWYSDRVYAERNPCGGDDGGGGGDGGEPGSGNTREKRVWNSF